MTELHNEPGTHLECTNPEIGALIGQYEIGSLSDVEQAAFEEHLLVCDHCHQEVTLMYDAASMLHAGREKVLQELKRQGVTYESTLIQQREQNQQTKMKTSTEKSKFRVVYWSVSIAVAAAAVFLVIGRMPDLKDSRFSLYINVRPMDSPTSLLLRGESPPPGNENYQNGLAEYAKGDYNRAERLFTRAVKESPEQGEWWLILGVCQVLLKNSDAAIQSLMEADKLTTGESQRKARWYLSQSYLMNDDLDNSVKLLEWLVNERKDHADDARNLLWKLRDDNILGAAFSNGPYIISPRGGEIFVFGSPITLSWKDPDREFSGVYEIWLSKDRGLTCALRVASNLPAGETSWVWDAPIEIGSGLAFRIEAIEGETRRLGAVSKEFAISAPTSLKLLDGSREATLYDGFSYDVHWAMPGQIPQYYRLELWTTKDKEPRHLRTLATKIDGKSNSWNWVNPGPVGSDYLLRLEAVFTDSTLEDFSDNDFAVLPQPKIAFGQVEFDEQNLELSLGWSHTARSSSQQLLYLRSNDNSFETILCRDFDPNQKSWRGDLAGVPSGSYDIFLTLVFPDGEVTERVGSQIFVSNNTDQRRSLDDEAPAAEVGSLVLKQNYPNPFNASTTIEFELTTSENIELKVFNMLGQEVKSLMDGRVDAGVHSVQFDASGLASGTYIYRLKADTKTEQKRMVLVK